MAESEDTVPVSMLVARHSRRGRSHFVVVIPARDEADTVGDVVRDVRAALNCCVVVVDDASHDGTAAEAAAAGATVLSLPFSMGAWGAAQAGLRYAQRHGYRIVVTMDADGQHHASSIPELLKTLHEGTADVVIGACPQRLSIAKRIAWSYFRTLTNLDIHDFTSGLRAYNATAIALLGTRFASLLDYQDIGVLILLKRQGLKVEEVTVEMSERLRGHSRVFSSWFVVARYMLQTTILCLARVGRGTPRRKSAIA